MDQIWRFAYRMLPFQKIILILAKDFMLRPIKIRQNDGHYERQAEELNKDYDIVIGNVADDDVFKTVDMYFRGLWDKQRTIDELRYFKMNDQICIVNQQIVSEVLKFERSYCVDEK